MFRLGSFLFIPAYLTLPLIRIFASPDKHGGPVVMTCKFQVLRLQRAYPAPIVLQWLRLTCKSFATAGRPLLIPYAFRACRYAGGTFSYTSVMILLVRRFSWAQRFRADGAFEPYRFIEC